MCLVAMTTLLGACSSDDESPIKDSPSASATADAAASAADEQALEKLATDVWKARETAGQKSDPDRSRFEPLLQPQLIETETATLANYKSLGVTREGAPVVTDVEATVSGATGTVTMCLNEDEWVGFEKGREIKGEDAGTRPYAFSAAKADGTWKVSEIIKRETITGKSC